MSVSHGFQHVQDEQTGQVGRVRWTARRQAAGVSERKVHVLLECSGLGRAGSAGCGCTHNTVGTMLGASRQSKTTGGPCPGAQEEAKAGKKLTHWQ